MRSPRCFSLRFPCLFLVRSLVESQQHGGPQKENYRNTVEELFGVFRVGRRSEVGPESELVEGNRRQINPFRSADFVFPVYLVIVLVGFFVNPSFG